MGRIKRSSPDTLLNAVAAQGAGSAVTAQGFSKATLQVVASSVSSGGVIALDGSVDGTSFGPLTPKAVAGANLAVTNRLFTISSNGTYLIEYEGLAVKDVKANLSTRTDGTYTAKVWLSD